MFATIFVFATEAAGEAAEEASGVRLVLPDISELLWGAIAFAILLGIMWKFVFPQLGKMLDERGTAIQGQLEAAEREKQQAETLRRQYDERLADARNEAATVLDDARQQGERVRAEIVSRAEAEAQQIIARAREEAEAERGRLIVDLRGQVAALSVDLASKIVQRELNPEQHRALVDQYINELSGMS